MLEGEVQVVLALVFGSLKLNFTLVSVKTTSEIFQGLRSLVEGPLAVAGAEKTRGRRGRRRERVLNILLGGR